MKNLIVSAITFGFASVGLANHLTALSCEVSYSNAGNATTQKYEGVLDSPSDYFIIDQKVQLPQSALDLYVFYDGEYSAITFGNLSAGKYYNADAEVTKGKLFSLTVRSTDLALGFDTFAISCKGQ